MIPCTLCKGDGYIPDKPQEWIAIFEQDRTGPVKYLNVKTQEIRPSWDLGLVFRLCPYCLGKGEIENTSNG